MKTDSNGVPERFEVERELRRIRGSEGKESFIASALSTIQDDGVPNIQQFTDLNSFFEADSHALIEGRTGYGKTTLLLAILKKFLDRGTKVLFRDPADEFCYLSKFFPTQIFMPEDSTCTLELFGFDAEIVKTNSPKEVIKKTYENNYPLNVMLYDGYTVDPEKVFKFYGQLFLRLMHKCLQTRRSQRRELIFSLDELNDLVPPRGKGLTEAHVGLGKVFEYNIRKFRKYKVRILSTAQRFNQISIDVRSQFDNTFIKKSFGYDVWNFFAQQLVTSNNKTFWKVLRHVIGMPVNEFLFFDKDGHFDFYTYPDIPRLNVEVEMLGTWKGMPKKLTAKSRILGKTYALDVKVAELDGKGYSRQEITAELNKRGYPYSQTAVDNSRQRIRESKNLLKPKK